MSSSGHLFFIDVGWRAYTNMSDSSVHFLCTSTLSSRLQPSSEKTKHAIGVRIEKLKIDVTPVRFSNCLIPCLIREGRAKITADDGTRRSWLMYVSGSDDQPQIYKLLKFFRSSSFSLSLRLVLSCDRSSLVFQSSRELVQSLVVRAGTAGVHLRCSTVRNPEALRFFKCSVTFYPFGGGLNVEAFDHLRA